MNATATNKILTTEMTYLQLNKLITKLEIFSEMMYYLYAHHFRNPKSKKNHCKMPDIWIKMKKN